MSRKSREEIDSELRRRIDRLRSGVSQAKTLSAPDHPADKKALDVLDTWLDQASNADTVREERISLVLKTEAELCLYEPRAILAADHIRLEDRLYRLSDSAQKAWKECLGTVTKAAKDEKDYRQLLRHLTYELAEAAESYQRVAKERATALSKIMTWVFVLIAFLIFLFFNQLLEMLDLLRIQSDQNAYIRGLPQPFVFTLLLSGSIGAMITVVRSLITEEKVRPDYANTLLVNILIRVAFGAVYAIAVVFALLANVLPVRPSSDSGLPMFLVLMAVAAGVSDKLFGQVISGVITGKREKKAKTETK
jgi:hypothetical protein